MIEKNTSVFYYQLNFGYHTNKTKANGDFDIHYLSGNDLKKELVKVFTNNLNDSNTFTLGQDKNLIVELLNAGKYVTTINEIKNNKVELSEETSYLYCRFGKKNVVLNLQTRDNETLEPHEIEKKNNEFFESYSYFYIFFETKKTDKGELSIATLAFLNAQNAPNARHISSLKDKMFYDNNSPYVLQVTPIVTEDGYRLIKSKDIINSLNYEVTLPAKLDVLSELFDFSDEEFAELRNLKEFKLSFKMKGKRSKDMFNERGSIETIVKFFDKFSKKHNANSFVLSADAKNSNEKMDEYNFLDNKFISKGTITFATIEQWQSLVESLLHDNYMLKRTELREAVRWDNK